jgi:hypothetical protein
VRITPPNYNMMRHEDKARALAVFGSLLQGTEKGLQVFTANQPYDPERHFRGLLEAMPRYKSERQRDHVLRYMAWFEEFTKRNQVLDRDFFLVFAEDAPLQRPRQRLLPGEAERRAKALRQLHAQAENVRSQFSAIGARCTPLDRSEALDLLQARLNPKAFSKDSKLDRLLHGVKEPEELRKGLLRIPDIQVQRDHLRIGQDYVRILTIRQYPERVAPAWLAPILHLDHRVSVSIHFDPKSAHEVLKRLRRSRANLNSRILSLRKSGMSAKALEDERVLAAIDEQILAVSSRTTKYFETTVWIAVHATSRRQLDELTSEVEYKLRNESLRPFVEPYTQRDAFLACLPLGRCFLPAYSQTFDLACAAATYPFLTSTVKHERGHLLGNHVDNGSYYMPDRWAYQNHNRIIAGTSGAGKSFSVKLDLIRTLARRPEAQVYIIDPLREFDAISHLLGGQIVYVGNKRTTINPFAFQKGPDAAAVHGLEEVPENPYHRKLAFLESFFAILFAGKVGAVEASHLKLTVQELYLRWGITEAEQTHSRPPPTLSDLLRLLRDNAERHADEARRLCSRNLATHLEAALLGPVGVLDGQTNVDLTSHLVCFDLKSLEPGSFQLFMFVVLDFIEQRMYEDPARPKACYIDESWILLENEVTARALSQMNRHTRHVNMGIDFITQTPDSFFQSPSGEAIRLTCAQTLLFRQETVSDRTRHGYGLDDAEAGLLMRLSKADQGGFSQALYITGDTKAHIAIFAAPSEAELATTRPEDLARRKGVTA